ncbi:MAG: SusD/RagB family nutrient-binding outer membrane lipoprotein [Flavobacterium sp.]
MKKIFLILGLTIVTFSCDDLSSLNENEKAPATVPDYTLFTNAEKSLTDQMVNTNVNTNIFRLISQYFTETTYTDESNYDFVTRNISDNHWNALYSGSLTDLETARTYLVNQEIPASDPDFANKVQIKKNKLAMIDILMCYTYQILVDTFGNVPYTDALQGSGNYLPKYDSGLEIYKKLLVRLDNAVANIDPSVSSFNEADVIYDGNLNAWVKFANSIKLKIGINLLASNLENVIATNAITSAVAGGLIDSNTASCKLPYMPTLPNTNPLFVDLVNSGRHDFVVTKPFVDKLISLNDPRRNFYTNGNANGGIVGSSNSYGSKTHVGSIIETPDFSGTLLDYAEVEFLLAEAVERGVAVGGTAEMHYNNAILASMDDWGVAPANAVLYLAQPSVAYATATGTWQQKIGEQAWIGYYNRGFEGWTSYRRLDFPILLAPANAQAAAEGKVPVRMAFPIREQTLNGTNYNAAASAIGGDKLTTKLFWDLN